MIKETTSVIIKINILFEIKSINMKTKKASIRACITKKLIKFLPTHTVDQPDDGNNNRTVDVLQVMMID